MFYLLIIVNVFKFYKAKKLNVWEDKKKVGMVGKFKKIEEEPKQKIIIFIF